MAVPFFELNFDDKCNEVQILCVEPGVRCVSADANDKTKRPKTL